MFLKFKMVASSPFGNVMHYILVMVAVQAWTLVYLTLAISSRPPEHISWYGHRQMNIAQSSCCKCLMHAIAIQKGVKQLTPLATKPNPVCCTQQEKERSLIYMPRNFDVAVLCHLSRRDQLWEVTDNPYFQHSVKILHNNYIVTYCTNYCCINMVVPKSIHGVVNIKAHN